MSDVLYKNQEVTPGAHLAAVWGMARPCPACLVVSIHYCWAWSTVLLSWFSLIWHPCMCQHFPGRGCLLCPQCWSHHWGLQACCWPRLHVDTACPAIVQPASPTLLLTLYRWRMGLGLEAMNLESTQGR